MLNLIRICENEDAEEGSPNSEPSSLGPLFHLGEAGPSTDRLKLLGSVREAEGNRWELAFIVEGWSKNGRYYPAEVLREAVSLFEDAPISIYGYDSKRDHVPPSVRTSAPGLVANMAGWCRNAREGEERGKFAIVADYECTSEHVRGLLMRAMEAQVEAPFGISIDALAELREGTAEGRRGVIVTKLHHVYEGTIVDRPAAGGRFRRVVASIYETESELVNKKKLMGFLLKFGGSFGVSAASVAALTESELATTSARVLLEMDAAQAMVELATEFVAAGKTDEALAVLAKLSDSAKPTADPAEEPEQVVGTIESIVLHSEADGPASLLQESRVELCALRLDRLLETSKLPESAANLVRARFSGRVFEAAELQADIDNVKALLAEHAPPSGPVQEANHEVSITHDAVDKWKQEGDILFGYRPEKDPNISESERAQYKSIGNVYSVKSWFTRGPGVVTEAVSADLPNVLGNSIHRAMIQQYNEIPRLFEDVIYISPGVDDFKKQERLIMHGFSDIPVVSEDSQYPDLGFPGDEKSEYQVGTRGGMAKATRRMFINDDLRAIQDIPRRIARGCRHTENLFRGALVTGRVGGGAINTDTVWDGLVLYHASHGNLQTAALSKAEISAMTLKLQNQREYANRTTLTGNHDNSQTAVTVASTKGLFVGTQIQIDTEIMLVTAVTSSTGLTVTRAHDGSSAAAHSGDAKVYQLGSPIPIRKHHLYHPVELTDTAWTAINSVLVPGGGNNDANFVYAQKTDGNLSSHSVHRVYLGNDSNNWFLSADKEDSRTFEMAYLFGREEPELILSDAPTASAMWNFDRMEWKVRHEYGGTQTDFRGIGAALVSG